MRSSNTSKPKRELTPAEELEKEREIQAQRDRYAKRVNDRWAEALTRVRNHLRQYPETKFRHASGREEILFWCRYNRAIETGTDPRKALKSTRVPTTEEIVLAIVPSGVTETQSATQQTLF